jgi:hypothetical protein
MKRYHEHMGWPDPIPPSEPEKREQLEQEGPSEATGAALGHQPGPVAVPANEPQGKPGDPS